MKKTGEILLFGLVMAVGGFAWKTGTYGATVVANKAYETFAPEKARRAKMSPMEVFSEVFRRQCNCPDCVSARENEDQNTANPGDVAEDKVLEYPEDDRP